MTSAIKKKIRFEDSTGKRVVATLWSDNSCSCTCSTWLRKTAADGSRECSHTLEIKAQYPEARSRTVPYNATARPQSVAVSVPENTPVTVTATAGTKVTVSSQPNVRVTRKFTF